jgi:hypothetical protein
MSGQQHRAGESFQAALLFAFENRTALIVHGWIKNDPSRKSFYIRYAWNELEGDVYDLTQHDRPMSKELFYRKHSIRENGIRRYSVQEAACMAVGTCSYGPWDMGLLGQETLTHEEFVERFGEPRRSHDTAVSDKPFDEA